MNNNYNTNFQFSAINNSGNEKEKKIKLMSAFPYYAEKNNCRKLLLLLLLLLCKLLFRVSSVNVLV